MAGFAELKAYNTFCEAMLYALLLEFTGPGLLSELALAQQPYVATGVTIIVPVLQAYWTQGTV